MFLLYLIACGCIGAITGALIKRAGLRPLPGFLVLLVVALLVGVVGVT